MKDGIKPWHASFSTGLSMCLFQFGIFSTLKNPQKTNKKPRRKCGFPVWVQVFFPVWTFQFKFFESLISIDWTLTENIDYKGLSILYLLYYNFQKALKNFFSSEILPVFPYLYRISSFDLQFFSYFKFCWS